MTDHQVEETGTSVVVLGAFHPGIIHPSWLAKFELLSESEAEAATVDAAAQAEFTRIALPWVVIQAFRDRLDILATTETPTVETLRDLAVGILELLPNTPVTRLAINRWAHVRMPSEDAWHLVGHRLAPKDAWEGVLSKPGMTVVGVVGERPDGYKGGVNVQVQPSNLVQPGVYVMLNDDVVMADGQMASDAVAVIANLWDPSAERFSAIQSAVIGGN
jgi:hypothetical protein